MNIIMVTNTYLPLVGGVEQSVKDFTDAYRRAGHRVLVIAPTFADMDESDDRIIRIPAVQNFNASDFSVAVPLPGYLSYALGEFTPDIVHSHHPFLLGDTALRIAVKFAKPLVFTFHTFHEEYTHYVPWDSDAVREFIKKLAVGYANICDRVIAPSQSVKDILTQRGVEAPMNVIPTGIHVDQFSNGDGVRFRRAHHIASDTYVAGFVSRLAQEKNLELLSRIMRQFLQQDASRRFLVVGDGPDDAIIRNCMRDAGVMDQVIMTGSLKGQDLYDAYNAMDVFAFCSQSETQGLVLVEAMAAGVPVVGLDAPGVREVVETHANGFLVPAGNESEMYACLEKMAGLSPDEQERFKRGARETAKDYDVDVCARSMLDLYARLDNARSHERASADIGTLDRLRQRLMLEWDLVKNKLKATGAALEEINPL